MKNSIIGVVVGVLIATTLVAQQPAPLVLKIVDREPGPNGTVILTLASSVKIIVSSQDIDEAGTGVAHQRMQAEAAPSALSSPATTSVATPSVPEAAPTAAIESLCASHWPKDAKKRVACVAAQRTAVSLLAARSMTTIELATIRTRCKGGWPGDYAMMNICEEQKIKALAPLGTSSAAAPALSSPAAQPAASAARVRCAATTQKGQQCLRLAEPGGAYCWQHK